MNDLALMFSIFVACRRAELTMSIDAAAAHAGISAAAWRDIESGVVVPHHTSWVIRELAHVLDVSRIQLSFIACVSEYNRSIQRAGSRPFGKGNPSQPRCVMGSARKRAVLYLRVSTLDQHPETQLHDLRGLASQRGYEIVNEYTDRMSGAKAKRPGLDQLMADARRGKFDIVLVWAFDRIARSVRHFLEVLDELNHLKVEFISFRENIDTGGPLGRAMIVIIGAIAELERNIIKERVKAGMRRAKLEGRHIGRRPLEIDRDSVVRDRFTGMSITEVAKAHGISRSLVCKIVKPILDRPKQPATEKAIPEPHTSSAGA